MPDQVYVGEFKEGRRHGEGKLECADGSVFEGLFANDKNFGFCRRIANNRCDYVGFFANDNFEGVGCLRYSDAYVIGQFVSGVVKVCPR